MANSGDFRRQVDVGFGHARRLAQVTLDPVHARCAAHALDRQLDLGGRPISGGGSWGDGDHWLCFLHTPGEYIPAVRIRQRTIPQTALPRQTTPMTTPMAAFTRCPAPWGVLH